MVATRFAAFFLVIVGKRAAWGLQANFDQARPVYVPDSARPEVGNSTVERSPAGGCKRLSEVPVYVLNLDRRPDRLKLISSALKESASPWLYQQACRVSALDGRTFAGQVPNSDVITFEAFNASLQAAPATGLAPPIIAVTIGHARIWEHVAQQSFPWAIIMEDDVKWLHPGLDDFLCNFEEMIGDEKWKRINLDACGPPESAKEHPTGLSPLRLGKGYSWCESTYILSKEAAKEAVERTFPIDIEHRVIDHEIATKKRGWWDYEFYTSPRGALQAGRAKDSDIVMWSERKGEAIKDCAPLDADKMLRPGLLQPILPP